MVLCGLDKEYKNKVKTQYPTTLDEAIKSAQIFDDMIEKNRTPKGNWAHRVDSFGSKGSEQEERS